MRDKLSSRLLLRLACHDLPLAQPRALVPAHYNEQLALAILAGWAVRTPSPCATRTRAARRARRRRAGGGRHPAGDAGGGRGRAAAASAAARRRVLLPRATRRAAACCWWRRWCRARRCSRRQEGLVRPDPARLRRAGAAARRGGRGRGDRGAGRRLEVPALAPRRGRRRRRALAARGAGPAARPLARRWRAARRGSAAAARLMARLQRLDLRVLLSHLLQAEQPAAATSPRSPPRSVVGGGARRLEHEESASATRTSSTLGGPICRSPGTSVRCSSALRPPTRRSTAPRSAGSYSGGC